MAKQRYINTKFWSDSYIIELNPLERYLFLYLLTNEHTNICGIYELPLKTISFETGIDQETLLKMFKKFTGKIEYIDNWVCFKNFIKHQTTGSDKVEKGIIDRLKDVPKHIVDKLVLLGYPIHTLLIGYIYPSNYLNRDRDLTDISSPIGEISVLEIKKQPEIREISDYFLLEVEQRKGFRPAFSGALEVKMIKKALKAMGSVERVKELIDYYLESKKCEKFGAKLPIALSTDTINSWKEENESYAN